NVCFDALESRKRRAGPIDLHSGDELTLRAVPGHAGPAGDPAEVAESRESVRQAFACVLRHLPPKQRAVLILREGLRWTAPEIAELLGTSVASVNSALQRARANVEASSLSAEAPTAVREADLGLLAHYVLAFERYDVDALTRLAHEDAIGQRLRDVA